MKDKDLFTVIVADDEEVLREAVCRLIPWESIGFKLLGSAGNGLDALQMVEQLQPDLLLTDIHMPFISGTDLAKQVRELQPLIQIAFLSGHDDFEYAKLGIEYDVISYLLKPISMEELTAALRDIHSKMAARFQYLSSAGDTDSGLQLTVASLLLDGSAEPPEEAGLLASLSELGFVVTAPYQMTVLATHVDSPTWSAADTIDKVVRKYYSSCSIASGGRILTLLASEDNFSRLGTVLDELLQVLRRLLDDDCVIGVSRRFNRIDLCHSACREAVDTQRASGASGIHHIEDLLPGPEIYITEISDGIARLEKLLYGTDRYELERQLAQLFPLSDGKGEQMAALQILIAVRSILLSALPASEVSRLLQRCGLSEPLTGGMDIRELERRIKEMCIASQVTLAERRQGGVGELCGRALRMIEQEYMDPELSLASVSGKLHVSPNYLSANMKKYAGDTFINLLIKKRMEAALTLITSGGFKIAEVANRCGYADQHYFGFCFKKYYGVSPAKMRRSGGKEDGGEA